MNTAKGTPSKYETQMRVQRYIFDGDLRQRGIKLSGWKTGVSKSLARSPGENTSAMKIFEALCTQTCGTMDVNFRISEINVFSMPTHSRFKQSK